MLNVNQKSLNFHYWHEAAVPTIPGGHPIIMAVWFFSMQLACVVRQFLEIQMTLLFGCATSIKSTFDQ